MVARLELQAKSMAQKIVREKVEEHKQKKVVKQREVRGSSQRSCFDVALQDSFHFMFTIMDNQDKFLVGH